jgi:ribonucleoside-diphosphate reductase alpha chain
MSKNRGVSSTHDVKTAYNPQEIAGRTQAQAAGAPSTSHESLKTRCTREKIALHENSHIILEKRYLKKDENNEPVETPEEMFFRVAENVGSAETLFDPEADCEPIIEEFYHMMARLEFLPNSPTLMNAGRDLQQLSACFVLPVGDSMDEIFTAVKHTALIHKSGGGTGFSFSHIRPKNDRVQSTRGVSSGPVSFMRVFDAATETIKQGGTRRGANMGILHCSHPDILEFIEAKEKEGILANFNISVAFSNDFMMALQQDGEFPLVNPRNGEEVTRIKASTLFKRVVDLAWKNGEPGIIFLDRINEDNPTPQLGTIESTNPCGEQPLLPYESCNLGSINLAKMIARENGERTIDYTRLGKTVRAAVRFLDNVIEVNRAPIKEIGDMSRRTRKIGLGVMGFADMLVSLGIAYNSQEAVQVAEQVMNFIEKEARKVSTFLAEARGPYPAWEEHNGRTPPAPKQRNATVTTIAPTGTISMIAGCSSGIEPLFAIAYEKNVLDDKRLMYIHPEFKAVAQNEGFYSEEFMKMVSQSGSLNDIYGIPKRIRDIFVTSHDISPKWHITLQAAFQKYTDNSVSKTVNFPNAATPSDVEEVYRKAYELGCKGVTVYRDGSREKQVITSGENKGRLTPAGAVAVGGAITPRPRPSVTQGRTYKTKTGCGKLYVNVNTDDFGLCEVFTQMGKSGGCAASNSEAVARLISLALRSGIQPREVVEQLQGIRCPIPIWHEGEMVLSCADAIARLIDKAIKDFNVEQTGEKTDTITYESGAKNIYGNPQCPECGNIMENEGGCAVCRSCGFSKCS